MSATHTQIAEAVRDAVIALALPGLSDAHVVLTELPADRDAVITLPGVTVSKSGDPETIDGEDLGATAWGYPVLVSFVEASDQSLAWNDRQAGWRQAVRGRFHQKPLAAVDAWRCLVEPRAQIDLDLWHGRNLSVGQLMVWVSRWEDHG